MGTAVSVPIFRSADFVAGAGIPAPTAKRIIPLLRDAGILKAITEGRGRRSAVLALASLLNIAEGRQAF